MSVRPTGVVVVDDLPALVGDMGGADTHDYLSGIDALVERGIVDGDRVGLIGGSYGGFMSSWLVTQDQRFAAAVPISPVTDWYSQSFTSNIAAWGNRFLDADPELIDFLARMLDWFERYMPAGGGDGER